MPTANKARGEMDLEVGDRSFVLRPSFETLSKIEDVTGKGAMTLIQEIREARIAMRDIVVVLWMAAKGSKDNKGVPKIEEFGESIRRNQGLPAAGWSALGFLSSSISTDEQIREEAEKLDDEDEEGPDPSGPSEESKPTEGAPDPSPAE